jgi:hypothetical protein
MKRFHKILLGLVVCLCGTSLDAQPYFQHVYGNISSSSADLETGFDGHRITNDNGGFMISGAATGVGGFSGRLISFAVTDPTGNFTTGFKKYYAARSGQTSATTIRAGYTYCAQVNDTEFGIAGVCSSVPGAGQHLFYAHLDASGNVMNSYTYSINANYSNYSLHDIVPDATGQYVYLVGDAKAVVGSNSFMYVMRLKYNGTIDWSQVYDIDNGSGQVDWGMDGVEVPGGQIFAVAGNTFDNGTAYCGFIYELDATTGLPFGSDIMLLKDNTNEFFSWGIDWSTDQTLPNRGGYVVAGNTIGGPMPTAFVVDSDFSTPYFRGNTYSTTLMNNDSYVYDVGHRVNGNGDSEYLLAGITAAGYYGGIDIEVFKVDENMNSVGQMVYGDVGAEDARAIDVTPGNTGMAIFGTSDMDAGNIDMLITRAYFSGELPSPCNWDAYSTTDASNLSISTISPITEEGDHFSTDGGSVAYINTMNDHEICFDDYVIGGSNNKTSSLIANPQAETLVGNPMEDYAIALNNTTGEAFDLQLSICDMAGKELKQFTAPIKVGENRIDLHLRAQGLANGMYLIRYNSMHHAGSMKLILQ